MVVQSFRTIDPVWLFNRLIVKQSIPIQGPKMEKPPGQTTKKKDTERVASIAQTFIKQGDREKAKTLVSAMEMLDKQQRNQPLSDQVEAIAKEVEKESKTKPDAMKDAQLIREVANNLKAQERRKEQLQGFVDDVQTEVQMLSQGQEQNRHISLPNISCSPTNCFSPSVLLVLIIICLISGWFLWGGTYMYSHRYKQVSNVQPKHVAPMILITFALVPMIFLKAKSPEEEQFEGGGSRAWMYDEHNVFLRSLDRTLIVVFAILLVCSGLVTMFFLCEFDFFMDPPVPKNETETQTEHSRDNDSGTGWMLIFSSWLLAGAVIFRWMHIRAVYNYQRKLRGQDEEGVHIELRPLD